MIMKRFSTGNALSSFAIAKNDKEAITSKEKVIDEQKKYTECGLKNPCVFGKHNPKFKIEFNT